MTQTSARLDEELRLGDPAAWSPMAGMKAVTVAVRALLASSPANALTVQLRKATSNAGANATNLGSAVTAQDYAVLITALEDELGDLNGVAYTHVSATITDEASPNAYAAVMLFEPKKNTPSGGVQHVNRG